MESAVPEKNNIKVSGEDTALDSASGRSDMQSEDKITEAEILEMTEDSLLPADSVANLSDGEVIDLIEDLKSEEKERTGVVAGLTTGNFDLKNSKVNILKK